MFNKFLKMFLVVVLAIGVYLTFVSENRELYTIYLLTNSEQKEIIKSAIDGDAKAQYSIGAKYEGGYQYPFSLMQDYELAAKWYLKSAKQGNVYSQDRLGMLYEEGNGVPQDYNEAIKWYKLAANQGGRGSAHKLYQIYSVGTSEEDIAEAQKWRRIAYERF